jgi:RNA polymerase-binding transcription factor DksA
MVRVRDKERARSRLQAERDRLDELRATLIDGPAPEGSLRSVTMEPSLADQRPAEDGTQMFERQKDLSILEQLDAEVRQVQRAIQRLDAGTYGICEDCGRRIAAARLEARPAAHLCVEDQARRERTATS